MKATIKNGELQITIPTNPEPVKSKTGKTEVIASTHGNQPVAIDGRTVYIGVNCYQKPAS